MTDPAEEAFEMDGTALKPLLASMRARLDLGSDYVGRCIPTQEDRRIFANAHRLQSDAKFLAADGRFATAFCIALLALEEVGKLIWRRWSALGLEPEVSGSAHRRKQLAVSAVGLAALYLHVLQDSTEKLDTADWNGAVWDALLTAGGGYLWGISSYTAEGSWDRQKKVGFYEDPDAQLPVGVLARDDITEAHVNQVLVQTGIAYGALLDERSMRAGPIFLSVLADRALWEQQNEL